MERDIIMNDKEEDYKVIDQFQLILSSLFKKAENDIIDFSCINSFGDLLKKHSQNNLILTAINNTISLHLDILLNDVISKGQFSIMQLAYGIILFLTILINNKQRPLFTFNIFSNISKTRKTLFKIIDTSDSVLIKKLISHLLFGEFKTLFFVNPPLTELEFLYLELAEIFGKKYNSCGIENICPDLLYSLLKTVYHLQFGYELYFKKNSLSSIEKTKIKCMLSQCLLRLVISKEKNNYSRQDKLYLSQFIESLVDNDMKENKTKHSDKYTVLFRKEILYDDLIKHIFFLFGTEVLNKSIIQPILKYVQENDTTLEPEVFEMIFNEMSLNTLKYLPNILRYLMKQVLIKAQKYFTFEDGKIFSPVFTLLLFNYYLSPKIQEMNGLSPVKYPIMIKINRLLLNICYNKQFDFRDELTTFNGLIELYHNSLIKTLTMLLKDNYDKISYEDIDNKILQVNTFIIPPSFLFNFDCFIINTFMKEELILGHEEKIIK